MNFFKTYYIFILIGIGLLVLAIIILSVAIWMRKHTSFGKKIISFINHLPIKKHNKHIILLLGDLCSKESFVRHAYMESNFIVRECVNTDLGSTFKSLKVMICGDKIIFIVYEGEHNKESILNHDIVFGALQDCLQTPIIFNSVVMLFEDKDSINLINCAQVVSKLCEFMCLNTPTYVIYNVLHQNSYLNLLVNNIDPMYYTQHIGVVANVYHKHLMHSFNLEKDIGFVSANLRHIIHDVIVSTHDINDNLELVFFIEEIKSLFANLFKSMQSIYYKASSAYRPIFRSLSATGIFTLNKQEKMLFISDTILNIVDAEKFLINKDRVGEQNSRSVYKESAIGCMSFCLALYLIICSFRFFNSYKELIENVRILNFNTKKVSEPSIARCNAINAQINYYQTDRFNVFAQIFAHFYLDQQISHIRNHYVNNLYLFVREKIDNSVLNSFSAKNNDYILDVDNADNLSEILSTKYNNFHELLLMHNALQSTGTVYSSLIALYNKITEKNIVVDSMHGRDVKYSSYMKIDMKNYDSEGFAKLLIYKLVSINGQYINHISLERIYSTIDTIISDGVIANKLKFIVNFIDDIEAIDIKHINNKLSYNICYCALSKVFDLGYINKDLYDYLHKYIQHYRESDIKTLTKKHSHVFEQLFSYNEKQMQITMDSQLTYFYQFMKEIRSSDAYMDFAANKMMVDDVSIKDEILYVPTDTMKLGSLLALHASYSNPKTKLHSIQFGLYKELLRKCIMKEWTVAIEPMLLDHQDLQANIMMLKKLAMNSSNATNLFKLMYSSGSSELIELANNLMSSYIKIIHHTIEGAGFFKEDMNLTSFSRNPIADLFGCNDKTELGEKLEHCMIKFKRLMGDMDPIIATIGLYIGNILDTQTSGWYMYIKNTLNTYKLLTSNKTNKVYQLTDFIKKIFLSPELDLEMAYSPDILKNKDYLTSAFIKLKNVVLSGHEQRFYRMIVGEFISLQKTIVAQNQLFPIKDHGAEDSMDYNSLYQAFDSGMDIFAMCSEYLDKFGSHEMIENMKKCLNPCREFIDPIARSMPVRIDVEHSKHILNARDIRMEILNNGIKNIYDIKNNKSINIDISFDSEFDIYIDTLIKANMKYDSFTANPLLSHADEGIAINFASSSTLNIIRYALKNSDIHQGTVVCRFGVPIIISKIDLATAKKQESRIIGNLDIGFVVGDLLINLVSRMHDLFKSITALEAGF